MGACFVSEEKWTQGKLAQNMFLKIRWDEPVTNVLSERRT